MYKTFTNDVDIGVGEDGSMLVGGLALVDGSVSEADIPQDQRSTRCQRTPEVLVYYCLKKKNHIVNTTQHVFKDVMQSVFAGGSVHKPDRGNPLMVQLMVGEGIPSAWQSSLTVSPGAYN